MIINTNSNKKLYNIISGISLMLWAATERLYIVDNLEDGYKIVSKMVLTDRGSAWIGVLLFSLMVIIAFDSLTNLIIGAFKIIGYNFRERFFFNQYYYIVFNILLLLITIFFIKIKPRSLFSLEMLKPHASQLLKDYWIVILISILIIAVNIFILSIESRKKSITIASISAALLFVLTALPILNNYFSVPTAAFTQIKLLLGEKKINGIYLFENRLIAEHSEEITVEGLPSGSNVFQMLVPTAFGIYQDECDIYDIIPNRRQIHSQYNQIRSAEVKIIDIWDTLNARKNENIYCRSADIWTKYGAYLAYKTASVQLGFTPIPLSEFNILHLDNFSGNLAKKVANYNLTDTVRDYIPKTPPEKSKNLLIIGDKYCNMLIPFFENHYENIKFVNISEYNSDFELENYQQILLIFAV